MIFWTGERHWSEAPVRAARRRPVLAAVLAAWAVFQAAASYGLLCAAAGNPWHLVFLNWFRRGPGVGVTVFLVTPASMLMLYLAVRLVWGRVPRWTSGAIVAVGLVVALPVLGLAILAAGLARVTGPDETRTVDVARSASPGGRYEAVTTTTDNHDRFEDLRWFSYRVEVRSRAGLWSREMVVWMRAADPHRPDVRFRDARTLEITDYLGSVDRVVISGNLSASRTYCYPFEWQSSPPPEPCDS